MKLKNAIVLNRLKKLALIVSDASIDLKVRYEALQEMRKIQERLDGVK